MPFDTYICCFLILQLFLTPHWRLLFIGYTLFCWTLPSFVDFYIFVPFDFLIPRFTGLLRCCWVPGYVVVLRFPVAHTHSCSSYYDAIPVVHVTDLI